MGGDRSARERQKSEFKGDLICWCLLFDKEPTSLLLATHSGKTLVLLCTKDVKHWGNALAVFEHNYYFDEVWVTALIGLRYKLSRFAAPNIWM